GRLDQLLADVDPEGRDVELQPGLGVDLLDPAGREGDRRVLGRGVDPALDSLGELRHRAPRVAHLDLDVRVHRAAGELARRTADDVALTARRDRLVHHVRG